MLAEYFPIFVMMIVAGGFAAVALIIAWLLAPSNPNPKKDMPYECGMDPIGDARQRFSVRFYVVAMLFIVFDLETVFIMPWAVVFKQAKLFYFLEMLVFLVILTIGLVYEWRMGAIDWNTARGKLLWRGESDRAA